MMCRTLSVPLFQPVLGVFLPLYQLPTDTKVMIKLKEAKFFAEKCIGNLRKSNRCKMLKLRELKKKAMETSAIVGTIATAR